ncbi:hypothetical protein AZZ82_000494, partial [Klebsiella aerogenes]
VIYSLIYCVFGNRRGKVLSQSLHCQYQGEL